MKGLRVLVGEDHRELRRMIVSALVSDFAVIGASDDGEELVEAAILYQPSVIICNIDLPYMGGFGVREELICRGLDYPFVFVTMLNIELASRVENGAVGFVHKRDIETELNFAVHAVSRNGFYISTSFRE